MSPTSYGCGVKRGRSTFAVAGSVTLFALVFFCGRAAAQPELVIEKDVGVPMRDGTVLKADVFRPPGAAVHPVLISFGPYNKDRHWTPPDDLEEKDNPHMAWETVNPLWWVPQGYAVVRVDARGTGKSPGRLRMFSPQETLDFYDAIEWAGRQPWSTGKVAAIGISYYAATQWNVAALQPPSLAAMVPWEGFADLYRDACYHGGIRSDGFARAWGRATLRQQPPHPDGLPDEERFEDLLGLMEANPLDGPVWTERRAEPSRIEVPFLSAGNWGGLGLHLRGNLEAFRLAASPHKRLRVHTGSHYHAFYSDEGRRAQKRFLDYWLKGIDDGFSSEPPIQLAIRHGTERFDWRGEREWPLARTRWTPYFLSPETAGAFPASRNDGSLALDAPREEVVVRYPAEPGRKGVFEPSSPLTGPPPSFSALVLLFDENDDGRIQPAEAPEPLRGGLWRMDRNLDDALDRDEAEHFFGPDPGRLAFFWNRLKEAWAERFAREPQPWAEAVTFVTPPLEQELEITGPVTLVLFVSSSSDDMDVFATLRNIGPDGEEVLFWDSLEIGAPVTKGWLRVSQRKTDPARSSAHQPFHSHDEVQKLAPGEVVRAELELWPTSMVFERGHRLMLDVQTGDSRGASIFTHDNLAQRVGENRIHTGGERPSYLLLPVIPPSPMGDLGREGP
jgi:predicted acyl esterase